MLVDDERHLRLALQELVELVLEARGVGHEPGLGGEAHDLELGDVPAGAAERGEQVLRMQHADDILRLVLPDRHVLRAQQLVDDLLGVSSALTISILVRWTMISDVQLAQVEDAAEHVRVGAGDRPLLLLQLDRAADLLASGENVGGIVGARA